MDVQSSSIVHRYYYYAFTAGSVPFLSRRNTRPEFLQLFIVLVIYNILVDKDYVYYEILVV